MILNPRESQARNAFESMGREATMNENKIRWNYMRKSLIQHEGNVYKGFIA